MATKSGSGKSRRKAAPGRTAKASGAKATGAKAEAAKAVASKATLAAKATAAKPTAVEATASDPTAADPTAAKATASVATAVDTESADDTASAAEQGTPAAPERKPWPIRLYLGEIGFDFIGKRKIWYVVSAVLVLICLGSMIFKDFNLGVEFAGGERFRSPGTAEQLEDLSQAVEDVGADVTSAQAVGDNQLVLITADLDEELSGEVSAAIADALGVESSDVTNSTTSASWGRDVTSKALQGLLVFLVLVMVFLAVRFQWKMAIGAMVALIHDLVITAGVYSLVGFEVTPASVIGLLTILGFSLYDTVVVFDKVDENAKGLLASQRRTYSESANLAINQVLMRSINTSIFALLPVLGLLYAGVFLIGEGTLQDLALVLFVGMLAGIYSSIFLAAPVLCDLKEREPEYQKLAKRLNAKRAGVSVDSATPMSTADTAVSPMAAAKADRRRGLAQARRDVRKADPGADTIDTIDSEESDGDDQSDDFPGVTGGGGTLVASARRTRPRSTRASAGTPATSTTKNGAVASAGRRGSPAKRNG